MRNRQKGLALCIEDGVSRGLGPSPHWVWGPDPDSLDIPPTGCALREGPCCGHRGGKGGGGICRRALPCPGWVSQVLDLANMPAVLEAILVHQIGRRKSWRQMLV